MGQHTGFGAYTWPSCGQNVNHDACHCPRAGLGWESTTYVDTKAEGRLLDAVRDHWRGRELPMTDFWTLGYTPPSLLL